MFDIVVHAMVQKPPKPPTGRSESTRKDSSASGVCADDVKVSLNSSDSARPRRDDSDMKESI